MLRDLSGFVGADAPQPEVNARSVGGFVSHGPIVPGGAGYPVKVEKSWAMVTGASAGIGREFATQLAASGYSVVLVARNEAELARVAENLMATFGAQTEVFSVNLLESVDLERVIRRLESDTRPIDVLVNNAGWGLTEDFHESTWEDEKDHFDIHVTVPLRLTHRVMPGMLERGSGRIIVVSSVAAFLSRGAYSAAKRYWVTLASSLNVSHRKRGVITTAVCPGFTRTQFHHRMGLDTGRIPRFAWLTAHNVVATGLRDSGRGKAVSIPSWRYRFFVAIAPMIPARFHQAESVTG